MEEEQDAMKEEKLKKILNERERKTRRRGYKK
jgi:hypothetical protein